MRPSKLLVLLVVTCLVAISATQVMAYGTASGCRTCHPTFQGRGALHDLHTQMNNNCRLCHTNIGDIPDINDSPEGPSCTGCHNPDGTWLHHESSGISCMPCHSAGTPPSEDTAPPYYGRADVFLTNPCGTDIGAGGEDYSGDGEGLDNDGDLLYDSNDPDCALALEESTWSTIKSLYN